MNGPTDFDNISKGLADGGTLALAVQRDGQNVNLAVPVSGR